MRRNTNVPTMIATMAIRHLPAIERRSVIVKGYGVNSREKELLENALDALDRLFDRQSSVIDVWALLLATREALRATEHHAEFDRPVAELLTLVRSGTSVDVQRDQALEVTDELRHYLAGLLPIQ